MCNHIWIRTASIHSRSLISLSLSLFFRVLAHLIAETRAGSPASVHEKETKQIKREKTLKERKETNKTKQINK